MVVLVGQLQKLEFIYQQMVNKKPIRLVHACIFFVFLGIWILLVQAAYIPISKKIGHLWILRLG